MNLKIEIDTGKPCPICGAKGNATTTNGEPSHCLKCVLLKMQGKPIKRRRKP